MIDQLECAIVPLVPCPADLELIRLREEMQRELWDGRPFEEWLASALGVPAEFIEGERGSYD